MKYAKVTAGVVEQVQPNFETGFIECPDDVVPGFTYNGETFAAPVPAFQAQVEAVVWTL